MNKLRMTLNIPFNFEDISGKKSANIEEINTLHK